MASLYTQLGDVFSTISKELSKCQNVVIHEKLIIEAEFHVVESWTTTCDFEPYLTATDKIPDDFEVPLDHALYHITGAKNALHRMLQLANLYPPALIDLPSIAGFIPKTAWELQRTIHIIFQGLEQLQKILLPDADTDGVPSPAETLQRLYLLTEFLAIRMEELKHRLQKQWQQQEEIEVVDETEET